MMIFRFIQDRKIKNSFAIVSFYIDE